MEVQGAYRITAEISAVNETPAASRPCSLVQPAATARVAAEVVLGGHVETGAVTEGPGRRVSCNNDT